MYCSDSSRGGKGEGEARWREATLLAQAVKCWCPRMLWVRKGTEGPFPLLVTSAAVTQMDAMLERKTRTQCWV